MSRPIPELTEEQRARFWSCVREGESGCWTWTGSTSSDGYGRVSLNRSSYLVHRVAYEEMCVEIPNGLTLDHLCRNRACVNPWHLEPVTLGVNTARGISTQVTSARFRSQTHCKQGHPLSGDNVRVTTKGYRVCRACHRIYAKRYFVPAPPRERVRPTHCVHGHEFTPENTAIRKSRSDQLRCRTCDRERAARYRASRLALAS